MEVQNIEFTVEQLLDLHRYWITELFTVDKKSEEEIVNLLHIHQINVTPQTLHSYLSNWNLLNPRPYDLEDWIIVPNADQPLSIQENDDDYSIISATSSQLVPDSYQGKPPPPPPPPKTSTATVPTSTTILDSIITTSTSTNPFLTPTSPPPQPVLKGLDTIPNGSTPLEFYSLDLQDHERRAVDLKSPRELWRRMKGKRKNELESSGSKRTKRAITMRSRKTGKK